MSDPGASRRTTDRPPGPRRPYERPAVIHTERIEARAVVCSKVPSQCRPGPAQS